MLPPVAPPRRRPPDGLAVASVALAVLVAVVQVVSAVTAFDARTRFQEVLSTGGSTADVLTTYDWVVMALAPVLLATYVVTCLWLSAARANAVAISPRVPHARSQLWVWLGWWVPVVALWFPYQVVRDVQRASTPSGRTLALGPWWTAWLVFLFGSRITSQLAGNDPEMVDLLPGFEVVTAVAAVIGCGLWCRLVLRITDQQDAAISAPPAPPPLASRPWPGGA